MASTYTLNFMGDTMLGRLVDQMFPQHVSEPEEAEIANSFRGSSPALMEYGPESPWGNALSLLHTADLNFLNLETSATTHPTKWPNKAFNYRMHPDNIGALVAAKIAYAGLANNHTLDFDEPGLLETAKALKKAGIAFAGAGETKEEATQPAVLQLPSSRTETHHKIQVWSAADHPEDWATVPTFHFIDYTTNTRERLRNLISKSTCGGALKIFSVHWGPNYCWQPSQEIQDLAHFLIDECGIDIIHGHSSHHVQGVEKYKGKLIIYGCGDFIDDYRVRSYRNDLSAIWQVSVKETADNSWETTLQLKQLKMYPTRIERFQVKALEGHEDDFNWVNNKIVALSADLDTAINLGSADELYATISLS